MKNLFTPLPVRKMSVQATHAVGGKSHRLPNSTDTLLRLAVILLLVCAERTIVNQLFFQLIQEKLGKLQTPTHI
jgi:hypothetical protein